MTMTDPIKELPAKGRWTVPAPTYVVVDADGVTAMVGAWNTVQALAAGRRILTDHLSQVNDTATAPAAPIHVYPLEV